MPGGSKARNDERLVAALAAGSSVAEAAAAAGVSESTAFRRLRDPAFQERVRAEQAQGREEMRRQLDGCGLLAIRTLRDLCAAADSESVRLRASQTILTWLLSEEVMSPKDAEGSHVLSEAVVSLKAYLEEKSGRNAP